MSAETLAFLRDMLWCVIAGAFASLVVAAIAALTCSIVRLIWMSFFSGRRYD